VPEAEAATGYDRPAAAVCFPQQLMLVGTLLGTW
jgi:hypothetical protein